MCRTERWQRWQAADKRREEGRKRNPFSKARRLPHCLFVFTAVIEVKLHISVRFFYFIALHCISFSAVPDEVRVRVCVYMCVCQCVCVSVRVPIIMPNVLLNVVTVACAVFKLTALDPPCLLFPAGQAHVYSGKQAAQ